MKKINTAVHSASGNIQLFLNDFTLTMLKMPIYQKNVKNLNVEGVNQIPNTDNNTKH